MLNRRLLTSAVAAGVAVMMLACGSLFNKSKEKESDSSPTNNDAKYERLLIGTWREQYSNPDGSSLTGSTSYFSGGKMSMEGTITAGGKAVFITASGTWEVKDGYLNYTIKSSNVPNLIPVGFSSADKIKSITASEFTYVNSHDQKTVVAKKVK
jgi:hypothetical protein